MEKYYWTDGTKTESVCEVCLGYGLCWGSIAAAAASLRLCSHLHNHSCRIAEG